MPLNLIYIEFQNLMFLKKTRQFFSVSLRSLLFSKCQLAIFHGLTYDFFASLVYFFLKRMTNSTIE